MMNDFLQTALPWILTASVKGAVLSLIVLTLLWLTRDRIPASWRYVLWAIVFLRLAIPVAPQSALSIFNLLELPRLQTRTSHVPVILPRALEMDIEPIVIPARELSLERLGPGPLAKAAAAVWLLGVLLLTLRTLGASAKLHWKLRRDLRGAAPQTLGPLRILETELVATPALHGIFRPILLVPPGFFASFEPDEQRFIYLHELAHYRRFDVAANWVIAFIQIIHWFNPLAWLAAMRIREERELACDESALHCLQQEEHPRYGRTVLKLLEAFQRPAPIPALLGILNGKQQMKRRILMISRYRTKPRTTLLFLALCLGLATVALTDARAGEKHRVLKLHVPEHAVLSKLDQKLSFGLSDATLGDVLTAISSRTGVAMNQSAEVLAGQSQQKRISIDADQVPAHVVLIETLGAYGLGFDVKDDALTVTSDRPVKRVRLLHAPKDGVVFEKKIIKRTRPGEAEDEIEVESNGETPEEIEKVIEQLEKDLSDLPGEVDRKVFVRKIASDDVDEKVSADGTMRRVMTIRTIENGAETEGKLTIELKPN